MGDDRTRTKARVLVLEEHVVLGQSLCRVLVSAGYAARHEAGRPAGLLARLRNAPPAVVVVGLGPSAHAQARLALVADVSELGIPVVGLAGQVDDDVRRRLVREAGAAAVVGRDDSTERFLEVVALAHEGAVSTGVEGRHRARRAGPSTVDDEHAERLLRLSARERVVLEALVAGLTIDAISARDHVAVSTVRTQVAQVLRKLGVSSQLSAVALFRRVVDDAERGAGPAA